jgi:hypothetical protein
MRSLPEGRRSRPTGRDDPEKDPDMPLLTGHVSAPDGPASSLTGQTGVSIGIIVFC